MYHFTYIDLQKFSSQIVGKNVDQQELLHMAGGYQAPLKKKGMPLQKAMQPYTLKLKFFVPHNPVILFSGI